MRVSLFILAISVTLISCNQNPKACVELEEIYEVDRPYTFTSCSEDYEFLTWEFGDGSAFMGETAPKTFTQKGDYTVTVTAYADGAYRSKEATADIKAVYRVLDRFTVTGESVFESFRIAHKIGAADLTERYPGAEGEFTEENPFQANFEDQMRLILPVGVASFSLVGIRSNPNLTPITLIDFESFDFQENLENPLVLNGKGFELTLYWEYE